MRTDVKLGVVFALVMVLAAGGYFMFTGEKQTPVSLAETKPGPEVKTQPTKPGLPAKTAANQPKTPTTNNNRPPITPKPMANNGITPGRTVTPNANTASQPANTPATPSGTASNPAMPRAATPMPVTPPPVTPAASPALATNSNPVANTGSDRPVSIPVNAPVAAPNTMPSSSAPSTVADRPVTPATGTDVGLTGIRNNVPVPAVDPTLNRNANAMTPLSNSPSGNVPSGSPVSPTNTNNTLPPGIRTATSPKIDSGETRKSGPADAAVERHKVQDGDSLSSLAQTYYGDAKYAKLLADANPKLTDPNRLKVGSLVSIPPLPADADSRVAGAAAPASGKTGEKTAANGKRTYTVKAGDSFYSIAKSQLGSASRWKELLALNNAKVNGDPTSLQPGQSLVLPESH